MHLIDKITPKCPLKCSQKSNLNHGTLISYSLLLAGLRSEKKSTVTGFNLQSIKSTLLPDQSCHCVLEQGIAP